MNVARLNMAHGTLEDHEQAFGQVRFIAQELRQPVGIMVDVPGPKYRTGDIPSGSFSFGEGSRITLTSRQEGAAGKIPVVPVKPAGIHRDARVGNRILLSDGMITLAIRRVQGEDVLCQALTPGEITSGRGVTTTGVEPSLPFLDEKALAAMEFAARHQADFVALSTVTTSEDVVDARKMLSEMGFDGGIYSKIERARAVTDQASIIDVSDGIIVARGDLGTEIRLARVPIVQKELIALCNEAGKPVITATQMLESMISMPVPTRAEVTDVANAVFDGTDAVMLSGETAVGNHPVRTVETMVRIASEVEASGVLRQGPHYLEQMGPIQRRGASPREHAVAASSVRSARDLNAPAIIVITRSGFSARLVASYRPPVPIYSVCTEQKVHRQLAGVWGVRPALANEGDVTYENLTDFGKRVVLGSGDGRTGDPVIVTSGLPFHERGSTNTMRVEQL